MGQCGATESRESQRKRVSPRSRVGHTPATSPQRLTESAAREQAASTAPGHETEPGAPLLYPVPATSTPVRYTLALDVDECLVRVEPQEPQPLIFMRPGLRAFVSRMSALLPKGLEVVLWTSSSRMQSAMAWYTIDPGRQMVSQIVWRGPKWVTQDPAGVLRDTATGLRMTCFKTLSLLGRKPDRCMLVDNAPQNCYTDQSCSILVDEFSDPLKQTKDDTLAALAFLVERMVESGEDVSTFLSSCSAQGLVRDVLVSVTGLRPMRLKKMNRARLLAAEAAACNGVREDGTAAQTGAEQPSAEGGAAAPASGESEPGQPTESPSAEPAAATPDCGVADPAAAEGSCGEAAAVAD